MIIASFDTLKALSSSADQENLCLGLSKGLNGGHSVAKLGIVSDLVDKPEPTTDVGGGGWGRKVSYGIYNLGQKCTERLAEITIFCLNLI